jgi:NADH-quinone oxidoreductase subunit N
MSVSELFYLLPLLIVLGGGVALMLLGALGQMSIRRYSYVALSCLGLAALFQMAFLGDLYSVELYPRVFNGMLVADSFSGYFNSLLIMAAILIILTGQHYFIMHRHYTGEFFALFMFAVFGMMMLTQATELLTAFIALEIASISVYAMIGYHKAHEKRVEASFKYLVLGSIAGALFLLGTALIYAETKTTHLGELFTYIMANRLEDLSLIYVGGTLILITFLFKIAAFPFQGWAIDVYDGAALPVTGFMAAAFKIAIFGFILRLMLVDFDPIKDIWNGLLIGVIVCTLAYGTLMAVVQQSIKRMLAASSIVHTGYLLIAFLSTDTIPTNASSAIIFYQVAYFLSAVGAFGLVSYIVSDDKLRITYEDFKGFAIVHPYMAAAMSVFMLSLAGIPSTIGFIGKFYIFTGAIQAGYTLLAILAIVATFISVYYYFKLIAVMYFYPSPKITSVPILRGITPKIIGALALLVILGGVGNVDFVIDLANISYRSLFLR